MMKQDLAGHIRLSERSVYGAQTFRFSGSAVPATRCSATAGQAQQHLPSPRSGAAAGLMDVAPPGVRLSAISVISIWKSHPIF